MSVDPFDSVAMKIVDLRMEEPVKFLIEAHLPFARVIHTLTLFIEPIATPFVGANRMHMAKQVFSEPQSMERLAARISFYAAKREADSRQDVSSSIERVEA